LSSLKSELEQIKKDHDELKKTSDGLQQDLIQARAQVSGLERVNFNYKNQLEELLKKPAADPSQQGVSSSKDRMESMIEDIKMENEELAQKDRLSQFELEKSRERVASLTREIEELKARVQQKEK
jgi:hypothetical protein